jgi:hypothetical protein
MNLKLKHQMKVTSLKFVWMKKWMKK